MGNFFSRRFLHLPYWLWCLLGIIVLLRIPSLFEPFYYGDELIYLTLGEGIRKGMVLYRDVFDHKTPFLYYLAAIAGNVFWFRLILGIWMVATTVLYYRLISPLFPKNGHVRFFSLLVFVILTTIPLWEGQIANAELFMMLPVIGGLLLLFNLIRKNSNTRDIPTKYLIASGIMFSIATLFKVPAMFEFGIVFFLALLAYTGDRFHPRKLFRFITIVSISFLIPIILSGIWFWLRGALQDYLYGGLLINVGYISAFRPGDVQEPFLVRNAPLLMRGLILLIGLVSLYIYRNKLTKSFIFLSAWLFFSLFAATLSERPYPHYLIQIAPALSGLVGLLLAGRTKEQVYTVIPISLALLAIVYFNFWYYHTSPYYRNFSEYVTGKINKTEYFNRFDGAVERNYKIAGYIQKQTQSDDPIFVWGDSSHIYAISKRVPPLRYLTSFHINDFYTQELAIEDLRKNMPKVIVILPNSSDFPGLRMFIDSYQYDLVQEFDGAEIWQVQ